MRKISWKTYIEPLSLFEVDYRIAVKVIEFKAA